MEKGVKYDTGKWRLSLLPIKALIEIIQVLEFGAEKYSLEELKDNKDIENILEEVICQKKESARAVVKLEKLSQKAFARLATEKIPKSQQLALVVECSSELQINHSSAEAVMKKSDSVEEPKNLPEKQSIKEIIEKNLSSEKKKNKEKQSVEKILITTKDKEEVLSLEDWPNMDLTNKNTTVFWKTGVKYAEAMKDHTWIMTTQVESSEVCFVVNATKDLDCCKMILQLCNLFWNTSLNIKEMVNFRTGEGNWKKVENAKRRYFDACIRHLTAWYLGEKKDPESGFSHLAHAACCVFFLMGLEDEEI